MRDPWRGSASNNEGGNVVQKLLHAPFFAEAESHPDRPAIIWNGQSISYRQLMTSSLAISVRLREHDLRPGDLVAIYGGRGPQFIAAMLGTLASGAAYVPIDHTLPIERVCDLVHDARPKVIIATTSSFPEELNAAGCPVVHGAVGLDIGGRYPFPDVAIDERDLAYVIFTSGSTGRPKGVMIEHAGPVNTIDDLNERFAISQGDRVLALSSFGFDLSVYDVFGVLAAGGTIVLPTDSQARDPAAWCELMRRHGVTIWNTVPALMEMLVTYAEANQPDALASLRLVWLSGDWIPVKLPQRIRALQPSARIISMGGATEASIWSIIFPIEHVDPAWKSIPYGKAMRNQTMEVLNADLTRCPVGVQGEIHIGGVGLARGYWDRPDITAKRFIADPRDPSGKARLYRTGDLGRLMPCGNIEFLGRGDTQVKINGNRVELAEIEANILKDGRIRETAVAAPSDRAGRRHLVAYLVSNIANSSAASQHDIELHLRSRLRKALPEYMVPARFVWLDALPLTENRKVDRQKLPVPDVYRVEQTHTDKTPPTDGDEIRLATLWKKVLELDLVGADDQFFDLGGDSFTATMATSLIEHEFGVLLTPLDLAEAPTLSKMARRIRELRSLPAPVAGDPEQPNNGAVPARAKTDSPWVEIRERDGDPLVFLPCLFGSLFPAYALAAKLPDHFGVTCLLPRGLSDPTEEPDATVEAMAEYAAREIVKRFPRGAIRLIGYSLGGTVAVETARQLERMNRQVSFLALVDAPARPRPGVVRWVTSLREPSAPRQGFARVCDRTGDRSTPYSRHIHRNACESYVPRAFPRKALVFRAQQARGCIAGAIDGWFRRWDWSDLLLNSPIYWLPSDHDAIFKGDSLEVLAANLVRELTAEPST